MPTSKEFIEQSTKDIDIWILVVKIIGTLIAIWLLTGGK